MQRNEERDGNENTGAGEWERGLSEGWGNAGRWGGEAERE
jgi:hypothetical protein